MIKTLLIILILAGNVEGYRMVSRPVVRNRVIVRSHRRYPSRRYYVRRPSRIYGGRYNYRPVYRYNHCYRRLRRWKRN